MEGSQCMSKMQASKSEMFWNCTMPQLFQPAPVVHLRDLERRARNSHNHFPDETNQLHQPDPMRPDERLYDNSDVHVVGEEGHEQGQNSVATPRLEQSHPEPNNRATLELDERSQLEAKKGVLPRHAFTWDFSQEIRQLLGASPSRQLSPSNSGSNTTYTILRQDAAPYDSSVPGLPHRDHIAYLAQVVDYHLNVNHRFLHLPTFLKQLKETSQQSMPISPIWRAKLWMVVALGKLFLENGATVSGPPGAAEFLESTRALPSQIVLDENPIMAIETFCLLALYAQSADLHRIAYLYISQANRMGHAWKLGDNHNHNHIAELEFAGENHIESLWCTVRILEQRSSATIGVVSDYNIHKQQYGSNQFGGLPNHTSAALQFNLSISNMLFSLSTNQGTL
ncbi:predicted protein [Paecilomyces variotii No. 5]|uniref:Transcription factor domain-containing protein n=1 Tax=Byssochlamys spectabilis (strain No. 5 / NBRC 109023) TaxID=1356009 RepID=V5FUE5_BYSSN|nr:predicted protein [Paecilomyces variotii No. 5]